MKPKPQCLNCEKPATKAGMCGSCYQQHYRERQPEAMEQRRDKYRRQRRKLARELLDVLHRVEELEDKRCFDDLKSLAEFKLSTRRMLDEFLADEPRLEVVK